MIQKSCWISSWSFAEKLVIKESQLGGPTTEIIDQKCVKIEVKPQINKQNIDWTLF